MAMGMMGFFVVHPRDPAERRVDRDFVFLLNAFDIEAGSYVPKVNTMLDFNLWCFNSRVFPGIDPLVVRQGDKVQVRFGNLTMTNHRSTCTVTTSRSRAPTAAGCEGAAGRVSVDVAVGQMRAFEFVADVPGDWALHCHKSHHTMNAMGHDVKTYIGVNMNRTAPALKKIAPATCRWAEAGHGRDGFDGDASSPTTRCQ